MDNFRPFYMVTSSGAFYEIKEGDDGFVHLTKNNNETHKDQLAGEVHNRMVLYNEDYSPFSGERKCYQHPIDVNTRFWSWQTTPIVGLFFNKEDAIKCKKSEDLKELDARWIHKTFEVVSATGGNWCKVRFGAITVQARELYVDSIACQLKDMEPDSPTFGELQRKLELF